MKVQVVRIEHHGSVFGDPIYLSDEDLAWLEACPVCEDEGGQVRMATSEGREGVGLVLDRCRACGHVYLARRPTAAWYQSYYAKGWDQGRQLSDRPPEGGWHGLKRTLKRVPGLVQGWRRVRSLAARRSGEVDIRRDRILTMLAGLAGAADLQSLPSGGRILEVGAGYGGALSVFRDAGFEAVGTEASAYRVQRCRQEGLEVIQTPIDDLSAVADRAPFDLVYSSHVFEHLIDPSDTVRQVEPLLREGGYVYLEVPHGPVAEHVIKLVHYPHHCHVFSLSSMETLLARFGLAIVRIHADANLHVVARKVEDRFEFPRFPVVDATGELLRGQGRWLAGPGRRAIYFDGWNFEIEQGLHGEVSFERARPYATPRFGRDRPSPMGRTFIVDLEKDESGFARFIHPTERAPIWLKFQ